MNQNDKPGTADLVRESSERQQENERTAAQDQGDNESGELDREITFDSSLEPSSEPSGADNGRAKSNAVAMANGSSQIPDAGKEDDKPLVPEAEAGSLRGRWTDIQGKFVDEPQSAVQEADTLVVEVIQSVARRFADERENLEKQWHSGSDVSTEDLRLALQHYRSFFQRLLAA